MDENTKAIVEAIRALGEEIDESLRLFGMIISLGFFAVCIAITLSLLNIAIK
jgi:hypothetical protein